MSIKYSATYNGVTRDVTDASGNSFVLKYGGKDSGGNDHVIQQETISAGNGRTLSCSGKLMLGDVKAGSIKTISCGGKKAASNIVVSSQSYTVYTWKKYNTVATPVYDYYLAENHSDVRLTNQSPAKYIADPGTPIITIVNGTPQFDWINASHQKVTGDNYANKWYSGHDDGVVKTDDTYDNIKYTNTAIRLTNRRLGIITYNRFDNAVYKIHQTGTNYSAGSYINDVTSTDPNAHPVNGRDPNDGYYYIRQ